MNKNNSHDNLLIIMKEKIPKNQQKNIKMVVYPKKDSLPLSSYKRRNSRTPSTIINAAHHGNIMTSWYEKSEGLLPKSMWTLELENMMNNYFQSHEKIEMDVLSCNQTLGKKGSQCLTLIELKDFFGDKKNQYKYPAVYKQFTAAQKKFSENQEKFNMYSQSECTYLQYIKDYYGKQEWFAFQRNIGEVSTSMIDIAARYLKHIIVIVQKDPQGKLIEIYRTHNKGPEKKVEYLNNNHFVAISDAKPQGSILNSNDNQQLGWNCFDIAVGIQRDLLVQYALKHAKDEEFRALLAPEIKHAAGLTATYMQSQNDQENKQHSSTFIPFASHSSALFMPHPNWLYHKIISMRDELLDRLIELAENNVKPLKNPLNLTYYLATPLVRWEQIADVVMSSNNAVAFVRTAKGLSRSDQTSDSDINLSLEKMRLFDAIFFGSESNVDNRIRKLSPREMQIIFFIFKKNIYNLKVLSKWDVIASCWDKLDKLIYSYYHSKSFHLSVDKLIERLRRVTVKYERVMQVKFFKTNPVVIQDLLLHNQFLNDLVLAKKQTVKLPHSIPSDDPINSFINILQNRLFYYFITVGCLATDMLAKKPGVVDEISSFIKTVLIIPLRALAAIKTFGTSEVVYLVGEELVLPSVENIFDFKEILSQSYNYVENYIPDFLKIFSSSENKYVQDFLNKMNKTIRDEAGKIARERAQVWYRAFHSLDSVDVESAGVIAEWEANYIIHIMKNTTDSLLKAKSNKKAEYQVEITTYKDLPVWIYDASKKYIPKSKKITFLGKQFSPYEIISQSGLYAIANGIEIYFDIILSRKGKILMKTCGKQFGYHVPATDEQVNLLRKVINDKLVEEKNEAVTAEKTFKISRMSDFTSYMSSLFPSVFSSEEEVSIQFDQTINFKEQCKLNPDLITQLEAPHFSELFISSEQEDTSIINELKEQIIEQKQLIKQQDFVLKNHDSEIQLLKETLIKQKEELDIMKEMFAKLQQEHQMKPLNHQNKNPTHIGPGFFPG